MKHKLLICSLIGMLLVSTYALAQSNVPVSFPPQPIELDSFAFNLEYDWVVKELTKEDTDNGLLFQADGVSSQQSLLVFAGEKGGYDNIYEMMARDEYAGGSKRSESQTFNNIEVAFSTNEETDSANAFFALDGVIYTFQLRNIQEKSEVTPLETLQSILLSLFTKE